MCGGGGKTTLCKKYPDKFLDIDEFMFQDIERKEKLMKCIASEEVDQFNIKNYRAGGAEYDRGDKSSSPGGGLGMFVRGAEIK